MELSYTKEHEWAKLEGGRVTFGITHYAQEQLGDVVFVELPTVGTLLTRSAPCGVIESVKAVSEIYAPVSGNVAAVNQGLADHPEDVNKDPYGTGWMVQVDVEGNPLAGLLSAGEYQALIGAEK